MYTTKMKTLSESLLSDFDTLEKKSDISMYLQKFWEKWKSGNYKDGCDAFGRPLKVGDLVIGMATSQPVPAMVLDINSAKRILVTQTGDGSDLKNSKGEIVYVVYQQSYEFLKIDEKILKMLYNIK